MNSFSIGRAVQFGWSKVTQNIGFFLLFMLLVGGVSIVVGLVDEFTFQEVESPALSLALTLVLSVINFILSIWTLRVGLEAVAENKLSFTNILPSWEVFWKFLLSGLLTTLIVGVPIFIAVGLLTFMFFASIGTAMMGGPSMDSLLWFVPIIIALAVIAVAIYLSIRLNFIGYFVVDKKFGPLHSIRESWRITKGQFWPLVGFSLVITLINLGGILVFLIGLLITIPLTLVATAYVYRELSGGNETIPTPADEGVPQPVPSPEG